MAIIIPSKNIYSKSFDAVIDNNIDKIEVHAITPSTVYDYDTIVYNVDYTNLGLYLPNSYDLKADNKSAYQQPATQPEMYYYAEAISFVNIRPAYTTVSVKIPKKQNDKLINKIYDKENIKYSLVIDEKTTVPISVTVNISSDDGKPTNSNIFYAGFNWDYDNRQTTQISGVDLKDYLSVSNIVTVPEANATPVQGVTATASKTLSNQENLPSVIAVFNTQDDTWDLLNLKILTAVYIEKAGENQYIKSSYGYQLSKTRTLNGTAEIYQAKELSITIYGDTINLNLQDKTVIIGDGNKVFSFDGNGLIQTTNTPTIETKYQGIINKWKNGKQTATITCPITDYYDTNGEIAISQKKKSLVLFCAYVNPDDMPNYSIFEPTQNARIKEGMSFFIVDSGAEAVQIQTTKQDEDTQMIAVKSTDFIENAYYTAYADENLNSEYYFQYPFIFNNGDVVIPYVYTIKGEKPLSYNKNLTPKQFKVVGTKISKRQGTQQELTLQEL